MRYIKISDLKIVFDSLHGSGEFTKWEAEATIHLAAIRSKTPKQRAAYWATNNIWTKLYDAMSELSGHKCWVVFSKV